MLTASSQLLGVFLCGQFIKDFFHEIQFFHAHRLRRTVLRPHWDLPVLRLQHSKTGTLNVKLTIEYGCSVFTDNANGTLDFGTWTTLSDNIDQSTTFNVSCTVMPPRHSMSDLVPDRMAPLLSSRSRRLPTSTKMINYNLFTDSTYSNIWGNTSGTDTVQKVRRRTRARICPSPSTAGYRRRQVFRLPVSTPILSR